MNITEFMSFDLDWFTTLPGLLITGGVIVLLIALIVFIASNKKEKNKSPEVAASDAYGLNPTTDVNVAVPTNGMMGNPNMLMDNTMMNSGVPSMDMNNINNPVVNPVNNVNPMENSVVNMNNDLNNGVVSIPEVNSPSVEFTTPTVASYDIPAVPTNVVDFSAPTQPEVNNAVVVPSVEVPVTNDVVVPTVENQTVGGGAEVAQSTSIETIPATEQVTPEVNPIGIMSVAEPVVTSPVEAIPAAPVEPVVQERPTIYGGVDPANTVTASSVEKPVIYGGANPLENTTTIPRMTNHEAYGMDSKPQVESSEATPVTPDAVTVTEAPKVAAPTASIPEPQVSMPEMPATPAMPMTGADMFTSNDTNISESSSQSSSDEIETLEF